MALTVRHACLWKYSNWGCVLYHGLLSRLHLVFNFKSPRRRHFSWRAPDRARGRKWSGKPSRRGTGCSALEVCLFPPDSFPLDLILPASCVASTISLSPSVASDFFLATRPVRTAVVPVALQARMQRHANMQSLRSSELRAQTQVE